jgi:type IV pilus assembly protein PilA
VGTFLHGSADLLSAVISARCIDCDKLKVMLDRGVCVQCVPSRSRSLVAHRGFTLVELMVVVVIVGVMATVAVSAMSGHMKAAKSAEVTAMMQSIRAAQEQWRAENQTYLDVTQNGWYPRDPSTGGVGKLQRSFFFPAASTSHGDNTRWLTLNPKATGPVRYGYRVNAGLPGAPLTTPARTVAGLTWPAHNEPWYVIQALGDIDGDGQVSYFVMSSLNSELYSENSAE